MTRAEFKEACERINKDEAEQLVVRLWDEEGRTLRLDECMQHQIRGLARVVDLLTTQVRFDDEPRDGETQDQFERRVGKQD